MLVGQNTKSGEFFQEDNLREQLLKRRIKYIASYALVRRSMLDFYYNIYTYI